MSETCKYYARTSGGEPWELYRCPKNKLPLLEQPLSEIQCASKHHSWVVVNNIQGLWEETLTGWFDEENLISVEKAKILLPS